MLHKETEKCLDDVFWRDILVEVSYVVHAHSFMHLLTKVT